MSEARAVALSLLAVLGVIAVVAPASLALPGHSAPAGVTGSTGVAGHAANNTSMGGQVSSFMHASSGQASESVESGMWNAAFASASNKSAVVDMRSNDIANRLTELREEKQLLVSAWRNDEISRAEYQARMSAIVGRMAALNRSIDETEQQARTSGANVTRVQILRKEASNMTGPEVSAIAKSLAGGPPEGVPGKGSTTGPPDHAGPPNGTSQDGNGNEGGGQGPPGNESGSGNGGQNGNGNEGNANDGS